MAIGDWTAYLIEHTAFMNYMQNQNAISSKEIWQENMMGIFCYNSTAGLAYVRTPEEIRDLVRNVLTMCPPKYLLDGIYSERGSMKAYPVKPKNAGE